MNVEIGFTHAGAEGEGKIGTGYQQNETRVHMKNEWYAVVEFIVFRANYCSTIMKFKSKLYVS